MGNTLRGACVALALLFAAPALTNADVVKPGAGVVTLVNVRAKPVARAPIVGVLPKGTSARWLETQGKFYRVRLVSGTEGWVPKNRTELFVLSMKIGKPYRVPTAADVPNGSIAPGTYRIHVIDVGTGLAILIQGATFNMLYDGGSKDKAEMPDRVLAYLFAALGRSGGAKCVPSGDQWQATSSSVKIDHVFLSHPHSDHSSALARVLECYEVANIWDSGAINDTDTQLAWAKAIAKEKSATYHTVAKVPASRAIKVNGSTVKIPADIPWVTFVEGDALQLDADATATVLHANGVTKKGKENMNSTVLLVSLGGRTLLLMGDAESGERDDPNLGGIEQHLVDNYADKLQVDILQVGHHGSLTSSRKEFLDVVKPTWAIVSSGPTKYATHVLPDPEVRKLLLDNVPNLVETYEHDTKCPEVDKIGENDTSTKKRPGGCDSYVFEIAPSD